MSVMKHVDTSKNGYATSSLLLPLSTCIGRIFINIVWHKKMRVWYGKERLRMKTCKLVAWITKAHFMKFEAILTEFQN